MWSGFITGFAEKSVSLIEERDKEIRKSVNSRIEDMFKQAAVTKKEAEARREGLTSLANQLMGVGFSEAETRALLDNPEQAESVIRLVEASPNKMADPETKRKLFAPASERMAGYAGEKPMDYIKKIATPQRGAVPTVLPTEMRGAFGLPSGAEDYVKTLGLKEEDLATELPERGVAQPLGLDMSVFGEAKSFKEREDAAKTAMLDNPVDSPEYNEARTEYLKIVGINKAAKDLEESGGAMSLKESDIRSNLRQFHSTILDNLAGTNKNFVKITDNQGNSSYKFKGNKPEVLDSINKGKETAFKEYINRTYARPDGSVPKVVERIADTFLAQATVTLDDNGVVNPATVDPRSTEPEAPPEAASAAVTRIPVTAPNGKTYYFNTQAEADAFKTKAGIK